MTNTFSSGTFGKNQKNHITRSLVQWQNNKSKILTMKVQFFQDPCEEQKIHTLVDPNANQASVED